MPLKKKKTSEHSYSAHPHASHIAVGRPWIYAHAHNINIDDELEIYVRLTTYTEIYDKCKLVNG